MGPGQDKDPFEILGLGSDAIESDIKRVYRSLAKKYHPDNGSEPDHIRMGELSWAYDVLTDPDKLAAWGVGTLGKPPKQTRLENMATMYLINVIQAIVNDQAFGKIRIMSHFDRHIQSKKAEMSAKLAGKENAIRSVRRGEVHKAKQNYDNAKKALPLVQKFSQRLEASPEQDRLGNVLRQIAEEQQRALDGLQAEIDRLTAAVDAPVEDDIEMTEMREMVEACDILAGWLRDYTFKDPTPEEEAAFLAQFSRPAMYISMGGMAASSTSSGPRF